MMILTDADTNTLVRKAAGQESGLGHAGKSLAWVDHQGVRKTGHNMDDLTLDELKEREAKTEVTFDPYRHITKDEETTIRVINVLESVQ